MLLEMIKFLVLISVLFLYLKLFPKKSGEASLSRYQIFLFMSALMISYLIYQNIIGY